MAGSIRRRRAVLSCSPGCDFGCKNSVQGPSRRHLEGVTAIRIAVLIAISFDLSHNQWPRHLRPEWRLFGLDEPVTARLVGQLQVQVAGSAGHVAHSAHAAAAPVAAQQEAMG